MIFIKWPVLGPITLKLITFKEEPKLIMTEIEFPDIPHSQEVFKEIKEER